DGVAVVESFIVERDVARPAGHRSGRDQEDIGVEQQVRLPLAALDANCVRIVEARPTVDQVDVVALDVLEDERPERPHDLALTIEEIVHREITGDPMVDTVEPSLLEAGKVEGRLPKRFRRDRPGVDSGAADLLSLLDDGDAFAEVRGLRGTLLARRPGSDDDEVVMRHVSASRAHRPRSAPGPSCTRTSARRGSR